MRERQHCSLNVDKCVSSIIRIIFKSTATVLSLCAELFVYRLILHCIRSLFGAICSWERWKIGASTEHFMWDTVTESMELERFLLFMPTQYICYEWHWKLDLYSVFRILSQGNNKYKMNYLSAAGVPYNRGRSQDI